MKNYRKSRAYKMRLFLRAIEHHPSASIGELAELSDIARNTAAAYCDRLIELGDTPQTLLELTDKDLCAAMAPNLRTSRLYPFDELEMKLLRKNRFNKKQCYRRYLESIPAGAVPMTLRTFRDRLQKIEHKDPSMKLNFVAGDVMMADYAGLKPEAISPFGFEHSYNVFVATLPCSQRIHAEIHEFQRIEDWIDGLTNPNPGCSRPPAARLPHTGAADISARLPPGLAEPSAKYAGSSPSS